MCDISETEDESHFVFICLELNNADNCLVTHPFKPLSKLVEAF